MKIFLLRFFFFSLIFSTLSAIIILLPSVEKTHFLAGINEKHARIQSLTSPKIIIVGGSNSIYGIDSELIEKETKLHVANMSLHGGLSYNFMANEIKLYISEGDIIIISLEYGYFFTQSTYTNVLYRVLEVYPTGLLYVEKKMFFKVLFSYFIHRIKKNIDFYVLQKKKRKVPSAYSRAKINKYGDHIGHLDQKKRKVLTGKSIKRERNNKISDNFLSVTKELIHTAKAKKANVLFTFPPIAKSRYDKKVGSYIFSELKDRGYQVISKPVHYAYDDKLFFDTQYHLNKTGRLLRTKQLIDDISQYYFNDEKT
jgi:hypothetical protein